MRMLRTIGLITFLILSTSSLGTSQALADDPSPRPTGYNEGYAADYKKAYHDGAEGKEYHCHTPSGTDEYTRGQHDGYHEGCHEGFKDGRNKVTPLNSKLQYQCLGKMW